MLVNSETISVIIPTYNRAEMIEYSIKSILEQTILPNEIIIVDDASTDNTESVIASLNNNLIKFIKLDKNSGAQVARNVGIKNSKSKWISFLDSDDLWEKDKLQLQISELSKVNFNIYTVIHSNCYCYDTKKDKKWVWEMPITENNCYEDLLLRPSTLFPSLLVSKQALEEIGYLDEKVKSFQEWDTSIKLAKICNFIHIKAALFTYMLHDGETISKDNIKYIQGYLYVLNKFKNDFYKYHGELKWKEKINSLKEKALKENIYKEVAHLFEI